MNLKMYLENKKSEILFHADKKKENTACKKIFPYLTGNLDDIYIKIQDSNHMPCKYRPKY